MNNCIRIESPQSIHAAIKLPASKSISNRALIIRALCATKEPLFNVADCDDTAVMTRALNGMPSVIDIGAAGTSMRFLTAYLCTCPSCHTITGSERMLHRPIRILVDALRSLGAHIDYKGEEGFPPLHIEGMPLQGGAVTLRGDVSSQYISALLLIGPSLEKGLTITLTGEVTSRPYICLTIELMKEFGAQVHFEGDNRIVVEPHPYHFIPYHIENDWSAASYWYEMTALCKDAEVELAGLKQDSYQGDSRIAQVFERLGVATDYTPGGVSLHKTKGKAASFTDDFSDIPDMAQTVVVTCALLQIPFRITGLHTLKIKETDRIEALKKELHKLGYVLHDEEEGNVLFWEGETCEADKKPVIETYDDHRMAMAFAPAAFLYSPLYIAHPEVVTKSYVGYWDDLQKAGFRPSACSE